MKKILIVILLLGVSSPFQVFAESRVGIYGGTFDPPHAGHMSAIRAAIAAGELNEVIILVSENSARKPDSTNVTMRRELSQHLFGEVLNREFPNVNIRLLEEGSEALEVYRNGVPGREGSRGGFSSFAEYMAENTAAEDRLFIVAGSDVLNNPDGTGAPIVQQNVRYLGINREGEPVRGDLGSHVTAITPEHSTSSTTIRGDLAEGRRNADLNPWVYETIQGRHTRRNCTTVLDRIRGALQQADGRR